jgi:HD superfamily phosphohydrolase
VKNKIKIINDPVYGLINIPKGILIDLIDHPYFQRLRRIKQTGLADYVYHGAVHTRFQHAIGSMHLMSLAIDTLKNKGHEISTEEEEAVKIAILLHDIGHGPFSHALENYFAADLSHEDLSLLFMQELNIQFNGKLDFAIKIFKNEYHKKFLHQLISGQLDMDRLDYLRRDSFFTGVSEGIIGVDRIIQMIDIFDDNLVVEAKGIYSIEKFLIARRLMYWQVYFHKTVLVSETILKKTIEKIKKLINNQNISINNKHLEFLLKAKKPFDKNELLFHYSNIDDNDIISLLKEFQNTDNEIIKYLTNSLINRNLPKIIISKTTFNENLIKEISTKIIEIYKIEQDDLEYYFQEGEISNQIYNEKDENINILYDNKIKDITEVSDIFNLSTLDYMVKKYYICIPKKIFNQIKIDRWNL